MLFSRRVGFSGTPSDLLPEELGQCHYDEGVDGKIYHYLTSDSIMSSRVLGADWSVTKILDGKCATGSMPLKGTSFLTVSCLTIHPCPLF